MEFERDFLMRQIAMLTHSIMALATGKRGMERNDAGESENDLGEDLRERLLSLLEARRVDEAEDLLFESAETGGAEVLLYGAEFYDRLNSWSDESLAKADFSREEIVQGLRDLSSIYGIDGILDAE